MTTTLIIGGSSGIGLATAIRLAAFGDDVHIAGRNALRVATAATDRDLHGHVLDASDAAVVRALAIELGTVDRLIVTLSGNQGAGAFGSLDIGVLRAAFEEKFWPTATAIQCVLPQLAESGSITLVGAITARSGMPGTAGIAALNSAIEGLVQPLAAELAPARVNAVSPGYVDTPWWNMVPDADRAPMFEQIAAGLPTRRIATADDVAQAVVLLATNPNITGTVIESDGGAHLAA
ncbi:SDR family oxidoreductase [Humibacter antri]